MWLNQKGIILNKFKGNRRIWWLIGIAVTVAGIATALVVLPAVSTTAGAGGPDIHMPKMKNVPAEGTPRMHLDIDDKR